MPLSPDHASYASRNSQMPSLSARKKSEGYGARKGSMFDTRTIPVPLEDKKGLTLITNGIGELQKDLY